MRDISLLNNLGQSKKKWKVKDSIINILSHTFPLSVKEIRQEINRRYNKSITYQAVHKKLNDLIENRIVKRTDKKYMLDEAWIKQSLKSLKIINQTYSQYKIKKREIEKELVFENYTDCAYFIFDFIAKNIRSDDKIIFHIRRLYMALFSLKKFLDFKNSINKKSIYVLCKENKPLDKWIISILTKFDIMIKAGVDCAHPNNLLVFDDYIIDLHIFLDEESAESVDKLRDSYDKQFNLSIFKKFQNILTNKARFRLLVNQDKEIAKDISRKTMKHFN